MDEIYGHIRSCTRDVRREKKKNAHTAANKRKRKQLAAASERNGEGGALVDSDTGACKRLQPSLDDIDHADEESIDV